MYPMHRPPPVAGLYAISNRAAGYLYIGKTLNLKGRYIEWVGLLSMKGGRNSRMVEVFRSTNAADWTFTVLAELPGIGNKHLLERERRAITQARRVYGDKLLNGIVAGEYAAVTVTAGRHLAAGDAPLTMLRDATGARLTHREVAATFGLSRDTVKKRLRRLRDKGIIIETVDELKKILEKN